jgi:hypothetical protein
MREKQVMQITTMATVREGTRMPQSLKYAWRWLMGASAAAILAASIPVSANAQTDGTPPLITLCVGRNGKIAAINLECKPRQIQLTWNIPGPAGNPGNQGEQGPQGVTGEVGPVGPQGLVGNPGLPGPAGSKGPTGPTGPQGPTGIAGPIGNTGPIGPQGPTGDQGTGGTDGTDGDNITTLTGGTLGDEVGADTGIQLTPTTTSTAPLYLGPGNAASKDQVSVQVPTPGGEAFHLKVALSNTPGGSLDYNFIVCNELECDPLTVTCTIEDADTTCTDNIHEVDFLPGDTLSIQASSSDAVTGNTVDVSWSLDYAIQTTPDD